MFLFYILMLICCYLIYKDIIKDEVLSKKVKYILIALFLVLIILNPMIFGYYHTLLTEFYGMTFAVLGCYLSWKWMKIDFTQKKIKYCVYTLVLGILTSIAWQLKQPYVSTILFPVIVASAISIISIFIIFSLSSDAIFSFCFIISILVTSSLSKILYSVNPSKIPFAINPPDVLSCFISTLLTSSIKFHIFIPTTINTMHENTVINQNDSEYKSFKIVDANKEKYEIIYIKGDFISTGESIKFLLKTIVKDPKAVAKSYFTNYLASISIHTISFENGKIAIDKDINMLHSVEIEAIGFKMYNYGTGNVYPLSEQYDIYADNYREVNKPIVMVNWVMNKLQLPSTIILKITFLVLPLSAILSIIAVFRTKKRYNEKYCKIIDLIAILYIYSLLHILLHSTLGATIDRYIMPTLITNYIAIILSIYAIIYRKKYKIEK